MPLILYFSILWIFTGKLEQSGAMFFIILVFVCMVFIIYQSAYVDNISLDKKKSTRLEKDGIPILEYVNEAEEVGAKPMRLDEVIAQEEKDKSRGVIPDLFDNEKTSASS